MVSEKASYWMAVGVVALFAGNHFAARHGDEIRCLSDRSAVAVESVTGPASRLIATAEMIVERGATGVVRTQTVLAQTETQLASVQTEIECHEAAFARMRAEQARAVAMRELQAAVVCPRLNIRTVSPRPPSMHTDGPI
jgi:hypothetical protein